MQDWKAHVTLSLVGPATTLLPQHEAEIRQTLLHDYDFWGLEIFIEPDPNVFCEVRFDFSLSAETEEAAKARAGKAAIAMIPKYMGQVAVMEAKVNIETAAEKTN